ncbi:glycosyltransferase [Flavobacterium granuli]|uniref:Glycosyltransferase involved in cell wall biosynthesis n=1 Tax=Flavobacterium granuli TaxID=280093 RepID=A0ABU1RYD7_9FLAO|nr:glycosyltransferase [Flavobacterium granuli]MDR6843772.1 glycosyltransferase involved in cell wall biosynthesis [Flavobacterium granuli]
MLSILIPAYNYNTFPLVLELHKQCLDCKIQYEILCQDDASNSKWNIENQKINSLDNCTFFINNSNLGRGNNINSLVEKSKYEVLLLMDCDTFPTQNDFIQKYCDVIPTVSVVFGGIQYEKKTPNKKQLLRWVYGNKREAISLENRNKNPNNNTLTSNLLIKKEIITQYPFDTTITKYGYEDLCFLSLLKTKNIKVSHIDNPTYHLNLETSILFLEKTKTAIENLVYIINSGKFPTIESKINSAYVVLKKLKLVVISAYIFNKTESKIISNLLSKKPSLFLFDLYKLGYYCKIQSK